MKTNDAAKQIIKDQEGLKLVGYICPAGKATVGWGHTGPDIHVGMRITIQQAEEFLDEDLAESEDAVERLVKVPLTENQFGALVSFTFNLGQGALGGSTLLRVLNAGDYAGAASQFLKWVHAGKEVLPGLVTRRTKERDLFLRSEE